MPAYDYLCEACGPFTAVRPMAEFQSPHPCADCGKPARRAMLTAPAFSGLDGAVRHAGATNERSAHSPVRSRRHPASCGCCKPGASGLKADTAAKGFPSKRPWMISH